MNKFIFLYLVFHWVVTRSLFSLLYFFCSFGQVQLFCELTDTMSKVWNKIQKRGNLTPSSAYTETMAGPVPSSPVRSSVGTAPPDTSTCSPSADIGTTTEVSVSEKFCYQEMGDIYTTQSPHHDCE